jgi:hypothetical protein
MRQIDWNAQLSEEDKVWARQAGLPMVEQRIAANESEFGEEPSVDTSPDPYAKSVLDPTATASEGPVPTGETPTVEDEGDDYDEWKLSELKSEVDTRNEDGANITVTGTGKNGAIRSVDYIAALREHDRAS